jgi:TolB-like protein
VLAFENLSPDPDNAYFAEGIHEEILARLATIHDLKVISRNSTLQYRDKSRDLHDIAKQLGVSNILEGSGRREADQVRVNVQLIGTQTNSYIWVDTYNHKLTDITAVESEIAKGIAESLQVKLTAREAQALTIKPTNNPEPTMRICAAWCLTHAPLTPTTRKGTPSFLMNGRCNLIQALRWPGRDFPVRTRPFTSFARTKPRLDATSRDEL